MKKYDKLCKSNSGITLLALVITIIVLIILAGISINLLLGENGLIKKAQNTKETHTIEAIKEKLDIAKGSDYIEQKGDSSIDTYFAILEKEKIEPYTITNKQKVTESTGIIEVDNKYSYTVTIENNKNIKIEYEGKVDEIIREPDEVTIAVTGENKQTNLPITLNANIKVNGEDVTTGRYVINTAAEELGTEDSAYTGQISNSSIEIKLEEDNTYYIHTLILNKYGKKQENIKGPITVTTKYHTHEGDSSKKGGCYTKERYRTETYTYQYTCGYRDSENYSNGARRCPKCGGGMWHDSAGGGVYVYHCKGENNGTRTGTRQVLDGYDINCGKTETTVEGYTVNY